MTDREAYDAWYYNLPTGCRMGGMWTAWQAALAHARRSTDGGDGNQAGAASSSAGFKAPTQGESAEYLAPSTPAPAAPAEASPQPVALKAADRWQYVIDAVQAECSRNDSAGAYYPQVADEHRDDRRAFSRVLQNDRRAFSRVLQNLRWAQGANMPIADLPAAPPSDAADARLLAALRALLGQLGNIEVLGEWEAQDINYSSRKRVRAKVDKIVAECRAAIDAAMKEKP